MTKYIFVTGGVVSGLGKGITAASLGRLLKNRGYKITAQKLDPYMNVDPGTISPIQHGEVFVTEDGKEADLDLGHYERFINVNLTKYSNLTSGKVYWQVLNKERNGEYLGETVQIIPHVTNEVKHFIYKNAETTNADIMITEIGGTIGDIESQAFLEAIRQLSIEVGRKNCLFIHVCLVPYISGSEEYKTKPTQHSVRDLQSLGIHPDIVVARCDKDIDEDIRNKIALFCNVNKDCVISNTTLPCLYEIPLMLHKNGMDKVAVRELGLPDNGINNKPWEEMVKSANDRTGDVTIALVGKYIKLHDSYLSVVEALNHASFVCGKNVTIKWVDSDTVTEENAKDIFEGVGGIIIPGGFGCRGIEGMLTSCKYARENKIPYFAICLGMQITLIEFARNVLKISDANSKEFDENSNNLIIDLMSNQYGLVKGGTMRLGSYPCKVLPDTMLHNVYGETLINERHRHRYEFNNEYRQQMADAGLVFCGTSPDDEIVECVEINNGNFFVGVQFHPEFKSRPNKAHPLFVKFVEYSIEHCSK